MKWEHALIYNIEINVKLVKNTFPFLAYFHYRYFPIK